MSCVALAKVVGVEAHELGVRISLDLHVRSDILKFKFTFAVVRALANVSLVRLFPIYHLIHTKMADVVLTATADKHVVEVAETERAVELELVPCITVLREKITTFNLLYFMTCIHNYVSLFLFLDILSVIDPLASYWKQSRSSLEFSILSIKLGHISGCCSLICSILRS